MYKTGTVSMYDVSQLSVQVSQIIHSCLLCNLTRKQVMFFLYLSISTASLKL